MTFLRKKFISRRALLKGAGYSVGLPILEAMIPALSTSAYAESIKEWNFVYTYFPFGTKPLPAKGQTTDYRDFTLDNNLSTLRDLYNNKKLHIMSGMNHAGSEHGAASVLTANRASEDISSTVLNESFDFYLPKSLNGAKTKRIPLVTLGVKDSPAGQLKRYFISWKYFGRNDAQFNPKEMSSVNFYNRIFQNMGQNNLNANKRHDYIASKAAVDSVLNDYNNLKKSLGNSDQIKLEQYMESLRSVEKRLQDSLNNTPASKIFQYNRPVDRDPGNLQQLEEKANIMMDLIMIGFASGQNQVATMMMDNAARGFDFNRDYHSNDRDGGMHVWADNQNRDYLRQVQSLLARVYKNGVNRMIEHGIYENTIHLMSSECGYHHIGADTTFLASGGILGNSLGMTRHYDMDVGRFYVWITQKFGLNIQSFGKGSGTFPLG